MNCETAQQNLLLAQSNELSAEARDALRAHVAACGKCRAYEAEVDRMMIAFRGVRLGRDVRPETLSRIESEAQGSARRAPRRGVATGPSFLELWRPALVYSAAAVMLILVGVMAIRRGTVDLAEAPNGSALAWNSTFDTELDDVYDLLLLAEGGAMNGNVGYDTLEDVADELLELEDWQI